LFRKTNLTEKISRPRKDCSNRIRVEHVNVSTPTKYLEPLTIDISLSIREKVEKFSVEWFVKNRNAIRVFSGLSALHNNTWFVPRGLGDCSIQCILPEWTYPGGYYSLSLMVTIPLVECFDFVEDVCEFQVADMNPGGGGFIFTDAYGITLPNVMWKVVNNVMVKTIK